MICAHCTWSKSCLPVVLGRMANSSSASMVVTRTFICQEQKQAEIQKTRFRYVAGRGISEHKEWTTGWKKKRTVILISLFFETICWLFDSKMTKKSIPYILLFNQEHPIARGWWGLQSKNEAHILDLTENMGFIPWCISMNVQKILKDYEWKIFIIIMTPIEVLHTRSCCYRLVQQTKIICSVFHAFPLIIANNKNNDECKKLTLLLFYYLWWQHATNLYSQIRKI